MPFEIEGATAQEKRTESKKYDSIQLKRLIKKNVSDKKFNSELTLIHGKNNGS